MQTTEVKAALKGSISKDEIALEARELSGPGTLLKFMRAAWSQIKKEEVYRHNWHIEAYAYHLEAVTANEIKRLQIWVPPQSMKSMSVSVLWPAWEWTWLPWIRYWGGELRDAPGRSSGRHEPRPHAGRLVPGPLADRLHA